MPCRDPHFPYTEVYWQYILGKVVKTVLACQTKTNFFFDEKKLAWDGPGHCEINLDVIKSSQQDFRAALC